ncbi:MAG: histidine phosphatase family protein [Planctomycetes bacterium]|nr:histidine phosphatase family protein [Planctomycetota bacterium]
MLVYLLRHGVAEDLGPSGPREDRLRRLTKEGHERLRESMPAFRLAMREPPARLLSSPYLRALETAQILRESLELEPGIEELKVLTPEADPHQALDLLRGELLGDAAAGPFVLVGHEPHLGRLLGLLVTGGDHAAIPLRKGMLVAVEVEEPQGMLGELLFALPHKFARALRKHLE